MLLSSHRSLSLNKVKLLALAATASVVFTVGCGMGTLAPASSGPQATGGLSGVAHGGRQAITNANVFIMAAGDVGYGSPAEILAETTTDPVTGDFSFPPGSYFCPSPGSTPYSDTIYLVVAGGNPGVNTGSTTTNNTASVLLAVLGDCPTVLTNQPFVGVSEVSTFAGMTALQQFFNSRYNSALSDTSSPPTVGSAVSRENFGTSSGNTQGLANAAATVANLVNLDTGLSAGVQTVNGFAGTQVTVTPETTKMYAAANALSACVNSTGSGSPCSDLYTDTGAPASSDVLMASYNMADTSNITSLANVANTCDLGTGYAPYGAAACPTDWTLGVTYGSQSTTPAGYLMYEPQYLAIDSNGDVWIENYNTTTADSAVTELSPTGGPINQVLDNSFYRASGMAFDPSGNLWVPDYNYGTGTTVQEYTTGGATNTYTTNAGPEEIASDGNGDIFVIEGSYKGSGDLEEILSGQSTSTPATTISTSSDVVTPYSALAIDSNYTIWLANGTTLYQYLDSSGNYPATPNSAGTAGGLVSPEVGVAIDSVGNIWAPNYSGTLSEVYATDTSTITGPASAYTGGGITAKPSAVAVDGNGNIWVADSNASSGPIAEFSILGGAVSPSTGFIHTYYYPGSLAIDGSGNVWVGSEEKCCSFTPFITEIVGAAVPVVTPIAKGLPQFPGGPNNLGTPPLASYNFTGFTVTECAATCSGGGTPGVPTITLTEGSGDPVSFTTTLKGSVNGTVVCTTTGTYSNSPGTQITCVGPPNSLTPGTYTLDGQVTGDGVEYGSSDGTISFTVQP